MEMERDVYVLHENICCVLIQITNYWRLSVDRERLQRETDDEI
jgi:hypothetical protein